MRYNGQTVVNRLANAAVEIRKAMDQWQELAGSETYLAWMESTATELDNIIKFRPPLIGEEGYGEESFLLGDSERGGITEAIRSE
jgi:hypothetical protein